MPRKPTAATVAINQSLLKQLTEKLIEAQIVGPNDITKGHSIWRDVNAIIVKTASEETWPKIVVVADHHRLSIYASDGLVRSEELWNTADVASAYAFIAGFITLSAHVD